MRRHSIPCRSITHAMGALTQPEVGGPGGLSTALWTYRYGVEDLAGDVALQAPGDGRAWVVRRRFCG